jgi:hypothetical protein
MDINDLTLGQIKQLRGLLGAAEVPTGHPYEVGKNYFIRTVTYHLTGKLVDVGAQELVLDSAAWIADDGRFAEAMRTGNFSEVEPFPEGRLVVGRGSVIDAYVIPFALPRATK